MADTFSAYWARKAIRQKLIDDIYKNTPVHRGFADFDPSPGNDPRRYTSDDLPPDPRREATGISTASFSMMSAESDDQQAVQAVPAAPWPSQSKVCIIGAGVTGLYIAMILDSLNLPGLTYEILEGSDRIGGRMLTHRFSDDEHDYYDIGAMRFPDLKIMKRTFDLFGKLEIPLVTYYMDPWTETHPKIEGSVMTPTMFNDICTVDDGKRPDPAPFDPYHISVKNDGQVPNWLVEKTASTVLNEVFSEFKDVMEHSFEEGFAKLMEFDNMSTRQYLRDVMKYDSYTIQWLETNGTSTNLFDQSFTESVIDSFDFDAPTDSESKWYCINGGTSLVTKAMVEALAKENSKVETSKRVTKITQLHDETLMVSVSGELQPRGPYSTVFNTTSLGCLGRMDLTGLQLNPTQKDAIRSLHYDDSAKVAIKFSHPWWIKECGITTGGIGGTDLPLRTCVYPSYNLKDGLENPAVLLCSYTWAQDALRIGSLISPNSPCKEEAQLMDLMFDNLARLHLDNFNKNSGDTYTLETARSFIEKAYVTHHAFSWSHDPFTSGAFALFGPSQFRDIYPYLTRPTAKSRFHILGEASSAHHAWIVGSLESAYSGVYKFLEKFGLYDVQHQMIDLWGEIPEFKGETGKKGSIWLQVALGHEGAPSVLGK